MTTSQSLDTHHEDMIHDAQFDYYGKFLATASSDKLIKIFDVSGDSQQHLADLRGHEGPVWQVAWAHPKFGKIIASASYDRKVIIWKEVSNNNWSIIHQYSGHELSVNSISWAPHEFGLILACASSDGIVSIHSFKDNTWEQPQKIQVSTIGVNSVSWAPSSTLSSLVGQQLQSQQQQITQNTQQQSIALPCKRLVTGSCDNLIKIYKQIEDKWIEEKQLSDHKDWVRDVAWAPNIGLPTSKIASCSQDKSVIIWTQDDSNSNNWVGTTLPHKFDDIVWRVSWSVIGNILAVSSGDNNVTLWKEGLDNEWSLVSQVENN